MGSNKSSHCDLHLIGNYGNFLFYFFLSLGTIVGSTSRCWLQASGRIYNSVNPLIKYLLQNSIMNKNKPKISCSRNQGIPKNATVAYLLLLSSSWSWSISNFQSLISNSKKDQS